MRDPSVASESERERGCSWLSSSGPHTISPPPARRVLFTVVLLLACFRVGKEIEICIQILTGTDLTATQGEQNSFTRAPSAFSSEFKRKRKRKRKFSHGGRR